MNIVDEIVIIGMRFTYAIDLSLSDLPGCEDQILSLCYKPSSVKSPNYHNKS